MSTHIAIDLGATSGRVILSTIVDNNYSEEVVHRFPNRLVTDAATGHVSWDIHALWVEILQGLKMVGDRGVEPQTMSVDTWGVDIVLFDKEGNMVQPPYAYRDPHTTGIPDLYHRHHSREWLWEKTGIEEMNINTLYQLYAMRQAGDKGLEQAAKILFMPDAISYLLTGEMVTEYTIASTSAMVNARERRLDPEILATVGLTEENFGRWVMPGTVVGTLLPSLQVYTGLGAIKVVAVAGHDTASAVSALQPGGDPNDWAFLSSGTWSLLGVVTDEPVLTGQEGLMLTNEGGVGGKITLLKNICGMWLLERCRAAWEAEGLDVAYDTLLSEAAEATERRSVINPDDPTLANPTNMPKAICQLCAATGQPVPATRGEIVRCIIDSLASRYAEVVKALERLTGKQIRRLIVMGGGSRNRLLNEATSRALGVEVIIGPAEATAQGNILTAASTL
ncbi:MAG: rhamnulokinase [Bacteroidales bacterium]|nr:rhamnulokinase [Bacteroidales bacterium]